MNSEYQRNQSGRNSQGGSPTGPLGAHPVGTGAGAVGGALAGAAVGSTLGPVGTAGGAVVGGVAGAMGGSAIAEALDPKAHDQYWEKNYRMRPYVAKGAEYKEYRPAYRYGWESAGRSEGKSFDDLSQTLERDWAKVRGESSLTWDKAKAAVKDAWDHVAHGGRRD